MNVSWATIRRAVCWSLLFTVIPIGTVSSQPEDNPQAVTGKINLPEEVMRFLGAPAPAQRGEVEQQAAEVQAESAPQPAAGGESDSPSAPSDAPAAVTRKITPPAPQEKPAAEAAVDIPARPSPIPANRLGMAAPTAESAKEQPPAPLPSLFEADREKLKNAYSYNPAGKIDPFEPLFKSKPEEDAKAKKKKRPKRIPRTPLEMVDISQLKLSAIINAPSGNRALVEEASGKGYVVREGTPIGIHWGKVAAIEKDRVIVEEEVEDLMGDYVKRNREMKLNKPIGE